MTLSNIDQLPPEVMQLTLREITIVNDQPTAEVIEVIDNLNNRKVAIQNILSVKETLQPSSPVVFASVLPLAKIETTVKIFTEELIQRDLLIEACKKGKEELNETLEQVGTIISTTQQEQEGLLKTFSAIQVANQNSQEDWTKWQAAMMDFQIFYEELKLDCTDK